MITNSSITVLVVDDDEMIRECVAAYLEDEGFTVFTAESSEKGLESVTSVHPHVCITDMRLPGINGDQFIIRAHQLYSGTRYLLHTGMLYSLSDELRLIGMTADDVLLKPIHDLSKLVARIRYLATDGGHHAVG